MTKPRAPLKTEVRLVAQLLNEPADNIEQLAHDIITTLDEQRATRTNYVVVVNDSGILSAWGTYRTIKEALKSIGEPIIASKPAAKRWLLKLHNDIT
jgi:hypothetical protein